MFLAAIYTQGLDRPHVLELDYPTRDEAITDLQSTNLYLGTLGTITAIALYDLTADGTKELLPLADYRELAAQRAREGVITAERALLATLKARYPDA